MDIYLAVGRRPGRGAGSGGPGRAGRRCCGGRAAAGGAVSPRNSARRPPPSSARPPPRQLLKCRLCGSISALRSAALVLTKADGVEGAFPHLITEFFPALSRRPSAVKVAFTVWPPLSALVVKVKLGLHQGHAVHFFIFKIQRHFLLCDRDGWSPGTELPAPLFLPCPKPLPFPEPANTVS